MTTTPKFFQNKKPQTNRNESNKLWDKMNLKGFFSKDTDELDAKNTPNKTNTKLYFNSHRKSLPTRDSFKDRMRKNAKSENFVPSQDISQLLNKTKFKSGVESIKNQVLDIHSGKTFHRTKTWINHYFEKSKKLLFSKNVQLGLITSFITILTVLTIHLSVFSTDFLVKNYVVTFSGGSYLDKSSTQKVVQNFGNSGILGIIPFNHFWFLNSQSLTAEAKKIDPSITQVDLVGRYWPNEAQILITTEPILSTLNINSEYYLISRTGKVIGKDYGGKRQKVVIVRSSHKNVDSQELAKVFSEIRPDSSTGNNQLNRLYFIENTIAKLKEDGLNVVRTEIQTVFEKDTDVVFYTENNTALIFDSQNISIGDNINRLDILLNTTKIGEDFRTGKISYIDLRIKDRVYYCYQNSECKK